MQDSGSFEDSGSFRPTLTPSDIFERCLTLLEELTSISSPSGDHAGLTEANQRLAAALREQGLEAEMEERPDAEGRPMPVLHARGPAATAHRLLLVGHMDTVLAARAPERREDRLVATGAIDMKGGLVALVGALDLLAAEGKTPPRDLLLAVVPDEEVAGHISMQVMGELGTEARALWVLEPGESGSTAGVSQQEGAETIVSGRRGYFHWHLRIEGRSAHAGNAFWRGRSALVAAAEWCVEARRLARPGPGPMVNPGRMVAGEASFVADLGEQASLVGSPRQTNVVPDRALVDGEARFLGQGEAADLAGDLAELTTRLAAEHKVRANLSIGKVVPPVDPGNRETKLSDRAKNFAAARGWPLALETERGGISFPNFLPNPAAIPILDGLGPIGDGMHTREEYLDLRSLDRRIRLLADLLAEEGAKDP